MIEMTVAVAIVLAVGAAGIAATLGGVIVDLEESDAKLARIRKELKALREFPPVSKFLGPMAK